MEEDNAGSSWYIESLKKTRELFSEEKITTEMIFYLNSNILQINAGAIPKRTSAQCNVTWNSGEIAYKCRDCQFDSTCVVCVDCFREADHTGHDYSIIRTGGGCCDCGDPEAWDPKGFCKNHSISKEHPHPSKILSEELSQRIFGAVQGACEVLYQLNSYSFSRGTSKRKLHQKCLKIISWLDSLCSLLGDAAKWIIGKLLCTSLGSYKLPVEMEYQGNMDGNLLLSLFLKDEALPEDIQEEVHKLYFTLLGEPEFKEQFTKNFIKSYLVQLHSAGTDKRKALLQFSVQLFSTPSLVPLFIETSFLHKLFRRFEELIHSMMVHEDSGAVRIKWSESIIRKGYYLPLLYDLRYLISMKDISRYILYQDKKNLLGKIVDLYAEINETRVHQRVPSMRDCLQDDDTWASSWTLEEHLISVAAKLAKGIELPETEPTLQRSLIIEKIRFVLNKALCFLEEQMKLRSVPGNNENQIQLVKFQVSKDKVTLSTPLQKFLAIFLDRAINKLGIPLKDIIEGFETKFSLYMPEHSLRLQVLYAQSAAKMWIRNGLRFQWIVQMQQKSVRYYTHVPKDIFLLQCCASSMPPENLFTLLVERFELANVLAFHPKDSCFNAERTVSQLATVIEHFLELIAVIITNRTMTGTMTTEEKIRRFIVHLLFIRSSTHSELMNNMMSQYTKHPNLKQIISSVATFDSSPMVRGEPGKYIIKEEMWGELDPYFLHYSLSDLQEIQERYFSFRSSSQSKVLPVPLLTPVAQSFEAIPILLQSRYLHRIIFWVLLNATETESMKQQLHKWKYFDDTNEPTGVFATITSTHHALRLLYLSCTERQKTNLPLRYPQNNDNLNRYHFDLNFENDDIACNVLQEFIIPNLSEGKEETPMSYSILKMLIHIHEKDNSMREYIDQILEILKDISCELADTIGSLMNNGDLQVKEDRIKNDVKAKQLAKQKEVMEMFKKKQEAFMRDSATMFDMDDDDLMDDDNPICAVCKETCVPTVESPVGRVAYQQRAKVIPLLRSRHHGAPLPTTPYEPPPPYRSEEFRLFDILRTLNRRQVNEGQRQPENVPEPPNDPTNSTDTEESTLIPEAVWNEMITPNTTLDIQFCQHIMHINCFRTYFDLLSKQVRRQYEVSLDISAGEFNCPLCRSLSNVIVPLPPAEFLSENSVEMEIDSEKTNEDKLSEGELKLKNVYDTFAMNSSLVYNFTEPRFYIPFHAAYDILYISALRSKIELLEICTRNELIPPISTLAENRPIVQQLYLSSLGYKQCCEKDSNYDGKNVAQTVATLKYMIYGKDGLDICEEKQKSLLSCDLFGVLVTMIFYGEERIELERFDELVQILFAAQLLQILQASQSERNLDESVVALKSHPHVDELVGVIISTDILTKDIERGNINQRIHDQSLEFLRKVYILRHTLFDVYFSSLISESSDPFADLCEILIGNPQGVSDLDRLLRHWKAPEENIRPNASFTPFRLIDLPREYTFAYDKKYTSIVCGKCNMKPKNPALCLVCGVIVCAETKCCARDGYGECNQHAKECGDMGMFLLLYSTMVLLLHNGKGCIWDSLYFDEHGEVDENLLRGKELFLNEIKLKELYSIYLSHQVDAICHKTQTKRHSLVFWGHY